MRKLLLSIAGLAGVLWTGGVVAGGFPSGASTLPLLLSRGTDLACNQGDFVQCPPPAGDIGLATNKYHAYFVEVPAGTGNLTIELFDADAGAGAGEAAAGRDTVAATLAQSTQYSVLNPAGTAQAVRYARGNGVSASGGVTTGLATAAGVGVSCTTVGNTTGDNAWCPILIVGNPASGHWEIRVQTVNGSGLNYYGVRARDTVTNRDLNVYARSYLHYGNQNVQAGRVYSGSNAFFPYVTEGCQLRAADFDSDDDAGESIRYASRTLLVDQTYTEALNDLSGNNAWNDELLTFTTNTDAREYGIWRNECTATLTNSNHVTPWLGSEMSTASPPTAQPQGGSDRGTTAVTSGESYRFYFPNNNGGAPLKPYVEQHLSAAVAGTTPTPGQTANYNIALEITNPTPYPITFGTAGVEVVTTTVPADTGAGTTLRNYGYVAGSFSASPGCGTATTPAANASGNVVWNPGTMAANSVCTATYQVSLALGSAVPTGTVVPMTGLTTAGTTAVFLDETGTRFIFGPLCALQVTVGTAVSVPVTLSYFDARALGDDRLQVRFRSATEANTLGFSLLEGATAAEARALAGGRVAAQGGRSLRNHDYQLVVSGYHGGLLWLEEDSGSARHLRHGPFVVGQAQGRETVPSAIDWRPSQEERSAAAATADRVARGSGSRDVELRVDRDGAYRVRYEDLLAAGSDWNGVASDRIALLLDGVPVPIAVDGPAAFGPGSAIRFVGLARRSSLYTDERVYLLRVDPGQALRMGRVAPVSPTRYRDSADRRVEVAPNLLWDFASPLPDPWYALELRRGGSTYPSARLSLPLVGPDPGVDALLRLSLWGGADQLDVGGDHALSVSVNGQPLVVADRFDGINVRYLDRSVPARLLHDGDNSIEMTLEPNGLNFDSVVVDGALLVYRGRLQATADRLDFQTAGAESGDALFDDGFGDEHAECPAGIACVGYQAGGFGSLPASVYRVRGHRVDELPTGASSGQTLRFGGAEEPADRYLAASLAAHLSATIRPARVPVDLFAGPASYLAIGPGSVLAALDPLLTARRNRGLSARAVAIEDVYAQFGDGAADPEAVRRFIRQAAIELGTRYVLLAGGDTYDYKNFGGTGSVSLVPTFYRTTYPIVHYGPTDVPYGDLDGDGHLDLAVGRLPARNAAEMALLVDKTLAYEASPTHAPPLFAADVPGNGTNFGVGSDGFIGLLDPQYSGNRAPADRVYLSAPTSVPAARDVLFSALGAGRSLVSYYGHSNPAGWTFSGLLDLDDVQAGLIRNRSTPVVVTQWGCWGAFFVDPEYSTLAHGLLVGGPDGAVALIGATALTDSADDEAFAAQLLPLLSRSGITLGDALRQAQTAFATEHPQARDISLGTVLLGDPAIMLNRDPVGR